MEPRLMKRLLQAAIAALALIVLLAGASFWRTVERDRRALSAIGSRTAPEEPGPEAPAHDRKHYQRIADADPFNPTGPSKVVRPGPAKSSFPSLKLRGTVVAPPASSFAIIEDASSKTQDLYRIGEQVRGMTLTRIERKLVVLERDGSEFILRMSADDTSSAVASSPAQPTPAASSSAAEGMTVEGDTRVIEKQFVVALLGRVDEILSQMRVIPHTSGEGYGVYSIRRGSIVEQMGLRNRDIVRRVNGRNLNSMKDILNAYQSLSDDSEIVLEITRGGKPVALKYQIRD